MSGPTQANRSLELICALGTDSLLIERLSGIEHLGRPFEYRVQAFAANDSVEMDQLVGTRASVRLDTGNPRMRYYHGVVSGVRHVGFTDSGLARYELTLVPWIWLLSRTSDCRIFQEKSVKEILEEIFNEAGFSDFRFQLSGSYPSRVYCVQYRETDFNFVHRLLEHEGIYYFVEHEQSRHTIVFCDAMSVHKKVPGFEKLKYRAVSSGLREENRIHSWRISKEISPGAYALNSFDFESPIPSPTSKLLGVSSKAHPFEEGKYELYDNPGDFTNRGEGERYAKLRREEVQTPTHTFSAETDARGLFVGSLFEVTESLRKDHDGEYLISSMSFAATGGGYAAGAVQGGADSYECSMSGMEKDAVFRPSRSTPIPTVRGPQTAMVVGPAGEEIYTDKYGRVKLQFLWDRYGQSDASSSCWIRVSHLWAGKNWGAVAIPRIGQEVIVDFLEGDPDRPIVTGRVYNGDQMPPYELPPNKTQTGIKSRSSKGGGGGNFNEIRFEDKKGQEQVYIHAEKNQDNVVENDETTEVGHDRTETIGNDETITIGHDRTENVGNNETITIGKDRSESVGSNETITIGKDRTETVGSNETISIGKAEAVTIGKGETRSVGEDRTTNIGKNETLTVGKKITISAGDQITLQTGAASIILKKDGTITITGKNLTMKTSGKVNVKASGNIVMKGSKILGN